MDSTEVTLHSTWRGIALSYGGVVTLLLLAVLAVLGNASAAVSGGVILATVASALVVVLDLPVATTFTDQGVLRRALLRKHFIAWDNIRRVTRARKGLLRFVGPASGGYVAEVGVARHLLVDVRESQAEFDAIRRVLGTERAIALGFTDETRPPEATKPTWLYRREQWRPGGTNDKPA